MQKKAQNTRGRTFPPEVLTRDEIIALLDSFSRKSTTGIRNRALVILLWRAGLRISEALDLFLKDVDLERHSIRVLHGKGDKYRAIGIDAKALEILQTWVERRKALGFDWRSPLFCTTRGTRLASSYVRAMLPRQARRAGRSRPGGSTHTPFATPWPRSCLPSESP